MSSIGPVLLFIYASAVSNMSVTVKRGENVTLLVKTPAMRDVDRVTLSRYENQSKIYCYCSNEEKKRGCTATDNNRFKLQPGSENVSITILDARDTDAGAYSLEVIGNHRIVETLTLTVLNESSRGPSTTASPPSDVKTVAVVVFIAVFVVVAVVAVVRADLYKKKDRKKTHRNSQKDSEMGDSQSSISGADGQNTDTSSELCLVEKKPEDLDSTHPDTLNLIIIIINNNNNNTFK